MPKEPKRHLEYKAKLAKYLKDNSSSTMPTPRQATQKQKLDFYELFRNNKI